MRRATVSLLGLRTSPMRIGDIKFSATPSLFASEQEDAYSLPLAGISYAIEPDGFIAQARRVFKMDTLVDRHQLNVILTPEIRLLDGSMGRRRYQHTRYHHSHDAAALATLIGRNNRHLLRQAQRNTLRLAGLTHDRLTAAFGDLTKTFDPKAFDEDMHYGRLLVGEAWQALASKHQLRDKVLLKTILNEGLLGELHDLVDKIAYVARDGDELHRALLQAERCYTADEGVFLRLLERNPVPCSLWDSVTIVNGQAAFRDLARLEDFLMLRIYLFKNVYENTATMAAKTFFAGIMRRAFQTGQLSLAALSDLSDHELEDRLLTLDPRAPAEREACFQSKVEALHFETLEDTERARLELEQQGIYYLLVEERAAKKMRGATHLRVWSTKNTTQTFAELRPELAREIEDSLPIAGAYRLTYLPQTQFRRHAATG